MPLPELLDELFRLYRRNFSVIVGVSLIVALPGLIWTLLTGAYLLTTNSYTNLFSQTGSSTIPTLSTTQLSRLVGLIALGGLGSLIFLPLSVGAVYRAVTDVSLGRPVTIVGVIRETLARYFPLLGLVGLAFVFGIVWIIAEVIGLVLLVLPALAVFAGAVYFLVRWSLAVAAMMAEDIGPINGLRRSWNLVGGMWPRTFGILFVIWVLQVIVTLALGTFFDLVVGIALTGGAQLAVNSIGSTLLNAVISPILAIGIVLLYFDLRTRKEGLDLDQLARETSPGPASV